MAAAIISNGRQISQAGTDSRLGFGFRLGEHADFQVQFEIGPQQRTRPIGKVLGVGK
ncbi:AAEL007222-PA [Aedes aegypti]|uniref:AAEL007222-PA n=1 Tax=Aedes aegypti TaxID=7159 RepID=Q172Y3_AEDAE|nr:AAEL007222-PA [Aedes aegypti]